jgi:hypothetical protein
MTKRDYYRQLFELFLTDIPSDTMLDEHLYSHMFNPSIQDWCASQSKIEWLTGIGILDSVDLLYKEAVDNNNIMDT